MPGRKASSLTVLTAPTPQDAMAEALTSFFARCSARGLTERTIAFHRPRLESFRRYLEKQVPGAGPAQVNAATGANLGVELPLRGLVFRTRIGQEARGVGRCGGGEGAGALGSN